MILKNITTRKAALRNGLLFWITIEFEDDERLIHRCIVDLEKGINVEDVARGLEKLAQEVKDTKE